MEIRKCKKCGFILGTRPNLKDIDGVCSACINHERRANVDFKSRQEWLTKYIKENKTNPKYDALVAVSGGKDSTTIVRRLFENHGVQKLLLVNVTEEFTKTKAGLDNITNIITKYNCDLVTYRLNPVETAKQMKKDFEEYCFPLKTLEEDIYRIPLDVARMYNIKLVFYGENAEYEYGGNKELEIFHHASDDNLKIIYLGAIYPYEAHEWYDAAKEVGFKDLNFYNEWQRHGQIEMYSQIDSIGYNMGVYTKFVKFGFQRVTDMACRFVRAGLMKKEQAEQLIKDYDWMIDPTSKRDFCRTINISEEYFDEVIDRFANKEIMIKDCNGHWRRKDLM